MKNELHAKSKEQLASVFRVSRKTVGQWLRRGAPVKGPAGYDLSAWVAWRDEQLRPNEQDPETSADADRRYKIAKARREELRVGELEGKLIRKTTAARERIGLVRRFVGVLEQLPANLQSRLAGKKPRQFRKIIEAEIARQRERLAGEGA